MAVSITSTLPLGRHVICAWLAVCLGASANALGQVAMLAPPQELGGRFGFQIDVGADVNADGVPDIIICAPSAGVVTDPPTAGGRVFVYCGATLDHLRTIERHFPIVPGESSDGFADSAAGVLDINADGFDDIAVTAPREGPEGLHGVGRVYLYSGATGEHLYTLPSPAQHPWCQFGAVVQGGPDWDGDGAGELVINAAGLNCRFVTVHSGATGTLMYQLFAPDAPYGGSFLITAITGDVTGDGQPDLASMSTDYEPTGEYYERIYRFSGASGLYLDRLEWPAQQVWLARRPFSIGDVDGDGVSDLLVLTPNATPPGLPLRAGLAEIYSGATGAYLYSLVSPQPQFFGGFGWRGVALPDVDGDRRADFAITARDESLPGYPPQAGIVYVYSGGTGQLLRAVGTPNPLVSPPRVGWFGENSLAAMAGPSPNRRATLLVDAAQEWNTRGRVYLFPFCRADTNADGLIDSRDISRFITGWVMTVGTPPGTLPPPGIHHGDYNDDGQVTSADISAFINDWLAAIQAGGCP